MSSRFEDGAQAHLSTIQGYFNAGHELGSHSYSHTFFDQSNALLIHYTGTASTATISITSTTLALTTSLGENHTIDLTASPNNFLLGLKSTILGYGTYTVTVDSGLQTSNPFSTSLANVTSQDIKASAYQTVFDQTRLVTNEVTQSVNWFLANITGMTSVQTLVYPGGSGSESPTVRSIVNSLGLVLGARSVVTTYSQDLSNVTIYGTNAYQATQLAGTVVSPLTEAQTRANARYFAEWAKAFGQNITIYEDSVSETPAQNLTWLFSELQKDPQLAFSTMGQQYEAIRADHTSADGGLTWTKSYPDAHDYRLQTGSAAIDSGTVLSGYNLGCDAASATCDALADQGNYGAGWDMGAFVYTGSPAPPVGFVAYGVDSYGPTYYQFLTNNMRLIIGSGSADLSSYMGPNNIWTGYVDGCCMYGTNIYKYILGTDATASVQGWSDPEGPLMHMMIDYPMPDGEGDLHDWVDQFDSYEQTVTEQSGHPDWAKNGIFTLTGSTYVDRTVQLYCPDSSLCSGYTPSYTTVSDRILIGYQTPYDVMNINVHTANSGTVTWQYWNGTSFASLTTASDTTNGLQNNGSVTFLPPSNWQPHVVNGSQPKYWVQATIGSGTVSLARIYGDNLLAANGYARGWDAAHCVSGHINAGTPVEYCGTPGTIDVGNTSELSILRCAKRLPAPRGGWRS